MPKGTRQIMLTIQTNRSGVRREIGKMCCAKFRTVFSQHHALVQKIFLNLLRQSMVARVRFHEVGSRTRANALTLWLAQG